MIAFLATLFFAAQLQAAELSPCNRDSVRTQCQKKWTVLIHMAADNDLEPYAHQDLKEINSLKRSDRLDVLIQVDTSSRPPRHGDPQRRSLSKELETFLNVGIQTHPSQHYLVIIWGHGKGWKGLAENHSLKRAISIPELQGVLQKVSRQSLRGRAFDVLASDACLMQTAEVISQLSSQSRFIIGTSEIQAHWGFPYDRLLREIAAGRFAGEKTITQSYDEPYLLARMFPRLMQEQPETLEKLSLSSISTREWETLVIPALRNLSAALHVQLREQPDFGMDILMALQQLDSAHLHQRELGAFLRALKGALKNAPSPHLSKALDESIHAVERATVAYSLGTAYAERELRTAGARSLSVWLPVTTQAHEEGRRLFSNSRFMKQTGWNRWLDLLFSP